MTFPTNLLQLADDYVQAKTYFKDQGSEARKRLQAAIIVAETNTLKAEQKAVADEREACAKVLDAAYKVLEARRAYADSTTLGGANHQYFSQVMTAIASAADGIRARSTPTQRCPSCGYQHGHAIGCENNPVDIALRSKNDDCANTSYDEGPFSISSFLPR